MPTTEHEMCPPPCFHRRGYNEGRPSQSSCPRDQRKVQSRRRQSLFIGCLQLSLCILITIHSHEEFAKVAAFISSSSSSRARIRSRVQSRILDEASNTVLNHDTELSSSRNAADGMISKLADAHNNHDEKTFKRTLPTNHGLNEPVDGDSSSFANHKTTQSKPVNNLEPIKKHASNSTKALYSEVIEHTTSQTQAQSQQRRPLSGLSRTHQSLLSKTSHMRRQRFVTGKYPLYVEVRQNPTKKWLGLAESRIYLNG